MCGSSIRSRARSKSSRSTPRLPIGRPERRPRPGERLALMHAHPSFRQFVLKHLDATMSLDDATSIERNVREACPPRGAFFCAAVRKRLDELKNEPTQLTDETTDREADEVPIRPRQVPNKHGPR